MGRTQRVIRYSRHVDARVLLPDAMSIGPFPFVGRVAQKESTASSTHELPGGLFRPARCIFACLAIG